MSRTPDIQQRAEATAMELARLRRNVVFNAIKGAHASATAELLVDFQDAADISDAIREARERWNNSFQVGATYASDSTRCCQRPMIKARYDGDGWGTVVETQPGAAEKVGNAQPMRDGKQWVEV